MPPWMLPGPDGKPAYLQNQGPWGANSNSGQSEEDAQSDDNIEFGGAKAKRIADPETPGKPAVVAGQP